MQKEYSMYMQIRMIPTHINLGLTTILWEVYLIQYESYGERELVHGGKPGIGACLLALWSGWVLQG